MMLRLRLILLHSLIIIGAVMAFHFGYEEKYDYVIGAGYVLLYCRLVFGDLSK